MPMDKDGPYVCQCSTSFEGIYSEAAAITQREETWEEFTSVVNASLGLLENWLSLGELNGKNNYVSI